jgi:hydrogenase maturation protease
MLYPYRPSSVKNRRRWNFGVVYPMAYSEIQKGADSCFMQTECIAVVGSSAKLGVKLRFLQAVTRTIGELDASVENWPNDLNEGREPDFRIVESLEVDGRILQTWQEAVECEIVLPPLDLSDGHFSHDSSVHNFLGGRELEPVRSGVDGQIVGIIVRTKEFLAAELDVIAESLNDGLQRITVRVSNATAIKTSDVSHETIANRDLALKQSLLSAHTILSIDGGEFVSLIDPPAPLKEIVAACKNIGTWPVLAGEEGQRDGMLSSPIILYDYPQIAPESPGDLFDGTEIDEILALRILTLTEDEKQEMRHADDRSRQILERTESMPMEHFMKLHGVLRGLRQADEGKQ